MYSAQADVVDAADIADVDNLGQVAAAASLAGAGIETVVVATPQIVIDLQGPVVGEVGQALQYVGYLDADPLPDSSETFFVAVRLDKNGGADPMTAADLSKLEISFDGGSNWMDFTGGLPLVQDGNALTYEFPQPLLPGGFEITGPWSWNFRFTYADEGIYRAEATVVTADAGRTPVSNTATVQTTVFAQTPDIAITLQGPVSGIGVGEPAHYTGSLTADPLPASSDEFIVRVRLGKNGGADAMTVADLTAAAFSADGISWVSRPDVLAEIYPDPVDSNFRCTTSESGRCQLPDQRRLLDMAFPVHLRQCRHLQCRATVLRHGSDEVASNTASVATLVGLGEAEVLVDAGSLTAVYDGSTHAVTVTTVPAGLDVTVLYDGSPGAPSDAGVYAVVATIDGGQGYSGSTTASLTITPKPVTIDLSGLGPYVYDGNPHAATASVLGLVGTDTVALDVTYNGGSAAPVNAGNHAVVAMFATPLPNNYVALPAFGTLTIDPSADHGITLVGGNFVYDGAAKPATVNNPGGVAHTLVYNTPDTAAPVQPGSYTATLTVTDSNYVVAVLTAQIDISLPGVVFTLAGDSVGVAGSDPETWSHFIATTANPNGITLSDQLEVEIAIERGGGIAAGDVQLQVEPYGMPGTWSTSG